MATIRYHLDRLRSPSVHCTHQYDDRSDCNLNLGSLCTFWGVTFGAASPQMGAEGAKGRVGNGGDEGRGAPFRYLHGTKVDSFLCSMVMRDA